MPQTRPTPIRPRQLAVAQAVGLALCTLSHPVWAVGFGAGQIASTLGQPLDFSVQIAGEADPAALNCLSAEVLAGESRVDPHGVSSHLEPSTARAGAWLRVQTLAPIDEPVVTVVLSAGCAARLSRRFVVFVDPPRERVASSLPAVDVLRATAAEQTGSASSPAFDAAGGATVADASTVASPRTDHSEVPASRPSAPAHRAVVAAPRERARRVVAHPPPSSVADAARLHHRNAVHPPVVAQAPPPVTGARLRLDAEPDFAVLDAVRSSTLAASAPLDAPGADAARYSALEARLAKLDADSAAASANVDRLRNQLHAVSLANATVKPDGQRSWLWQGLSAALGGVVVLLAWQRWRKPPASDWRDSISPMAEAPVGPAANTSTAKVSSLAQASPPPLEDAKPDAAATSAHVATQPTPATPTADTPPAKAKRAPGGDTVGWPVDALLDIEQQFDFFTALGQDAAAIELMRSMLGSVHGEHPMPYLKLMEVHRRLGQEVAYSEVHTAFSRQFNGTAADWPSAASAAGGRTIEDYPEQLAALIDAWPTPSDAAATLDHWMSRTPDAANDPRFDMPAFRDLLFLHTLAREMTVRDNRPVVLQSHSFEPKPLAAAPSASIAAPDWARARDAMRGATDVDIELDLQYVADEDDGRFDLPLSASQAALRR